MRLVVLMLVCIGISSAQDARALVVRAVAADDHRYRLALNYTYKIRDQIKELDSAGAVKSVHSSLDEVLYIGGKQYFRPLEKDGKPIPANEARREQAKLDRAAAAASRLSEAEHNKRIEDEERAIAKRRAQFKDVPDAFDFKLLGESVIDGRGAYRISATPRPAYHGEMSGILPNLEGTVWIDKQDLIWVKFEADVLKSFSLGWFLARVGEGTHLNFQMTRVNGELWVPKDISLKASARLVLLKKVNVEQQITFSDYHKFQADSRMVSIAGEP
jgi:hypothetical protein